MKTLSLENKGSLITIAGTNQCLGYLMHFEGKGVYDAEHGRMDVTPEEAKIHNEELEKASLKGMDENCQVGQWGTFYFANGKVTTFNGTIVSDNIHLSPGGKRVTFLRNGKQYRGLLRSDSELFNFKRIS